MNSNGPEPTQYPVFSTNVKEEDLIRQCAQVVSPPTVSKQLINNSRPSSSPLSNQVLQNLETPYCHYHKTNLHSSKNCPRKNCQKCKRTNHWTNECRMKFQNNKIIKCYNCDKPGHMARNCNIQRRTNSYSWQQTRNVENLYRSVCLNCGSRSHKEINCPDELAVIPPPLCEICKEGRHWKKHCR